MRYLTKNSIKFPKRKPASHKGENGYVLVIGGSKDYIGAPYLAAKSIAALRAGCDVVVIAAPEKTAWAINCLSADLITKKIRCDYFSEKNVNEVFSFSKKFDVVLIGNGICEKSKNFVKKIIKKLIKTKKPLVIDADAIKAIRLQDVDNALITPHGREFEILLKNSKLNKNNFQKKLKNNVILLKGPVDKIISKNKIKPNKTGNAGMTVGGTGDVLAGLCAGFVSQGLTLFDAACTAAYVNGKVGDKLKKKLGYGFIASDFLAEIAKTIKRLE